MCHAPQPLSAEGVGFCLFCWFYILFCFFLQGLNYMRRFLQVQYLSLGYTYFCKSESLFCSTFFSFFSLYLLIAIILFIYLF